MMFSNTTVFKPHSHPNRVTRLGEISPLWQFFESSFCIGQNFEFNWASFIKQDKFSLLFNGPILKDNLGIWPHSHPNGFQGGSANAHGPNNTTSAIENKFTRTRGKNCVRFFTDFSADARSEKCQITWVHRFYALVATFVDICFSLTRSIPATAEKRT